MPAVAADTRAIIWHLAGSSRLSAAARTAFRQAESDVAPIFVSAISIVETRYLVKRGRIPAMALDRLVDVLSNTDSIVTLMPLTLAVATATGRIARIEIPEMPDRIIAATALVLGVPLVTADHRIRAAAVPTIW